MRKISAIGVVCLLLSFPVMLQTGIGSPNDEITLKNDYIEFKFSENFVLQSIKDIQSGRTYYFDDAPLWKITLLDVEKAESGDLTKNVFTNFFSNDPSLHREYSIDDQPTEIILRLTWIDESRGEINVDINLPKNSAISTWSISIENTDNEHSIWYVEFPYLNIMPIDGNKNSMFLAMPFHAGMLIKNPVDNIDWQVQPWEETQHDQDKNDVDKKGSYPGGYNAQFAAVYSAQEDGIYLAACDGEMYTKRFLFNGNGETLSATIRNYPNKMLTPAVNYVIPYSFKVGVFHGDWMDAADIYRNWAWNQKWCKKGPLHERNDVPKALRDIDLTTGAIYRTTLEEPIPYQEIKEDLLNMKDFFTTYGSVNGSSPVIGIHWNGWSKHLDVVGEEGVPNYFPAQENFSNMIDELHSAGGFYCDVYFGTGVFDTANPLWPDDEYTWEEAQPYACYNPLNQTYKKFQPTYAWMDPSTDWWQNVLASLAIRAQEEVHVDGTYWDHYPKFRLEFRHHEGGGNFYALGYRETMKNIKNVTKVNDPDHYTYPEGKSEIEVGVFDGMPNEFFSTDQQGNLHNFGYEGIPAPIIPYIYHEYISGVGGMRTKNKNFSSFRNLLEFRAVEATLWVWGNKPDYPFLDSGKSGIYVFTLWKEGELDPVWEENLTYLAELVKMYKLGKDALLFGKMLKPPMLDGITTGTINLNGQNIEIPGVLSSAFESPNGEIYIPLTNWVEENQKIENIDFGRCSWLPGSYELMLLNENGLISLGNFSNKIANIDLSIKPGEAEFLIIRENNISITITKPKNALYTFDKKILPLPGITIVFGGITVETEINGDINRVEFYVDEELTYIDDGPPYVWFWDEFAIGQHEVKVVAYTNQGNKAENKTDLIIFNFGK